MLMPNIHPVVVHFPIALLSIYALFEFLRFPKLVRQSWYTPVKCAFLFLGTILGFAALLTGGWAEDSVGESKLVGIHSMWAAVSMWIFAVLCATYLLLFISRTEWFVKFEARFKRAGTMFPAVAGAILKVAPIGAFVGLVAITVTGALGGAIIYGSDVDPVVHFIYKLLVK